jgi:coenzyme PQQ precursor peptide PqqA
LTQEAALHNSSGYDCSEEAMAWRKPKIVEVPVGAEINMYVCAEMKR